MDSLVTITAAVTLTLSFVGHTVVYWRTWSGIRNDLTRLDTKMNSLCNDIKELHKLNEKYSNLAQRVSKIEGVIGIVEKKDG